jgi:hypothetical protein
MVSVNLLDSFLILSGPIQYLSIGLKTFFFYKFSNSRKSACANIAIISQLHTGNLCFPEIRVKYLFLKFLLKDHNFIVLKIYKPCFYKSMLWFQKVWAHCLSTTKKNFPS